MYLFIELWKPKQAWLDLPQDKRAEYMQQLGPAIQQLTEAGMEIVSWSLNETDTPQGTDHTYIAAYKFPSKEIALQMEAAVEGAGWYNYFEQINAKGELNSPDAVIGHMIGL